MRPGIHTDISNADYHAGPGISSSQMKDILRSPAHFHARHLAEDRIVKTPTDAMLLGTIVHTLILEPHRFEETFAVKPKTDRRSKVGKAQWAAFEESCDGKTVITDEQHRKASEMAKKALSCSQVIDVMDGAWLEHSIYWTEWPKDSLLLKARPDIYNNGLLADIKTTSDARQESFARSCVNFDYPLSLAMYEAGLKAHGLDVNGWMWIVIESEPPHGIVCYVADEEMEQFGRRRYQRAVNIYNECMTNGDWPPYDPSPQWISLPRWAKSEEY